MSTDTLEFPPIEATAAPATEQRAIIPAAAPAAPDLAKVDLAAVALAKFGPWRDDVAAVRANLSTLVLDLTTASACKEARSLRQRIVLTPLADARKVAAGIKSAMAAASKRVGAELEQIEKAYTEADALILPRIEAREQELEAERQARAAAEAARVAAIRERIAKIRGYVAACEGRTSEEIAGALLRVKSVTIGADFEELADEAQQALRETIDAIARLRDITANREAEAARLEAQRREAAELEARLAAMRAEEKRLRDEAEVRAAAEREEIERREREAEEAAARERAAAAAAAEAAAAEAEVRAALATARAAQAAAAPSYRKPQADEAPEAAAQAAADPAPSAALALAGVPPVPEDAADIAPPVPDDEPAPVAPLIEVLAPGPVVMLDDPRINITMPREWLDLVAHIELEVGPALALIAPDSMVKLRQHIGAMNAYLSG